MKIIEKFTTVLFIVLSCSLCQAQMIGIDSANAPNILKNYNQDPNVYVFEGYVTHMQKKNIAVSNMGSEMICCVVQITKIFKGSPEIKLGTIKVLSYGFNENEATVNDFTPPLTEGSHIIFGRITNSNIFDSNSTDNAPILSCVDRVDFPSYYDTFTHKNVLPNQRDSLTKLHHNIILLKNPNVAAIWRNLKFSTRGSLYSLFNQNGLTIQEQVMPADSAK
jgi:hypothetical protein